jgi:UDP-N-acetylglucosamine 4,6-dehydratase
LGTRVLITGGTGFLGRHLALAMKESHDVTLAGRNNKQNMLASERTGCPVIPMDVTNIEAVRDAVIEAKPDIVVHAAATKYVDVSEHQPFECVDVNVLGSQNVARPRGCGPR